MISTKLITFSVYEAQMTKGEGAHFSHHRILQKVDLRPPPCPAKKSLNLHKKSQLHHRSRNKTITMTPGCELRLDADFETVNDTGEPSKHLRPLRTKGPKSCPRSINLLIHRREIQQIRT
ncbi:hypothetical protein Bca4012_055037 [Brassica carinata]